MKAAEVPADWITLTPVPDPTPRAPTGIRVRRVAAQVVVATVVVILGVSLAGVFAARRLAEAEAVTEAGKTADLLGELLVQPALTDAFPTGDPAAVAAVDSTVRAHVLSLPSVVRVKVWDAGGRILYSDEPRLIGTTFPLDDEEREVFATPRLRAEVSDLTAPENVYERDAGKLLEAYRPIWTPAGRPLLFEVYFRYQEVTSRSGQLWRGFAGVTVSSLLVMVALLVPILWRLLDRLRAAQQERVRLLRRAVDASERERRRIAGSLHDGAVQDLVATALTVSALAGQARAQGRTDVADQAEQAAATVRTSIAGLRSLLVDLYPPALTPAGLPAALDDMAAGLRGRGVRVHIDTADGVGTLGTDETKAQAVYGITRECLANVTKHARATAVTIRLDTENHALVLDITDDGVGFDAPRALERPTEGHFGLRILPDLARTAGAGLRVRTAPGAGTRWQVRWPVGAVA